MLVRHIRTALAVRDASTEPMHSADAPTSCSIPCDLCGSGDVKEISTIDRDGSYLRTVVCRRCGLVWSDPRPSPQDVRCYYSHDYRLNYKGAYRPKPRHIYRAGRVAIDRFRTLRRVLRAGCRVFDVGAGSGEVVYILRAMDYDASGLEPNEGYARFASEVLGLPVRHGFYQDAHIPQASQDVVTMYHVVEHLESPQDAVRRVRLWLKPGGVLLVEVPNVEAMCQRPRSRFHRAHLYNFNPATLEMLGRRAGLSVVSSQVSSDGGNVTVIFRSSDATPPASAEVPGNYGRVSYVIRRHTPLRHLLSPHPYVRPMRKIVARIDEWRHARAACSSKAILDRLISHELSSTDWSD